MPLSICLCYNLWGCVGILRCLITWNVSSLLNSNECVQYIKSKLALLPKMRFLIWMGIYFSLLQGDGSFTYSCVTDGWVIVLIFFLLQEITVSNLNQQHFLFFLFMSRRVAMKKKKQNTTANGNLNLDRSCCAWFSNLQLSVVIYTKNSVL